MMGWLGQFAAVILAPIALAFFPWGFFTQGNGSGGGGSAVISSISNSAANDTASGCPGDGVLIRGSGFSSVTGVDFNGTRAVWGTNGSTQIYAIVPNGATTGNVHAGGASSAFTVSGCPAINADLGNCSNLPASVTAARTGAAMYAMNGSTSTVTAWNASATPWVCEDQGGGFSGSWGFGAHRNNAAGANNDGSTDFTNAGWTKPAGAVSVAPGVALDPSGSLKATYLSIATGANPAWIQSGPVGASTTNYEVSCAWVRDGSPAETAAGAIASFTGMGGSTSLETGTNWRRRCAAFRKVNGVGGVAQDQVAIGPAGASSPDPQSFNGSINPTFDNTQNGGYYVWGADAIDTGDGAGGNDQGEIPHIAGNGSNSGVSPSGAATSADVLQVVGADVASLLDSNNNLHFELDYLADPYFTQSQPVSDDTQPYVFSAATPGGLWFCRSEGQTTYDCTINGSTAVGAANPAPLTNASFGRVEVGLEFWSRPNAGFADGGVHVVVNGSFDEALFSPFSTQMQTPTAFYIGSKNGTSNFYARAYTRIRRMSSDPHRAEFVHYGDSLTGFFSPYTTMTQWFFTFGEARSRDRYATYAFPGESIAQQKARYMASPQRGKSYVKAYSLLIGQNSLDPSLSQGNKTAAQAIADLQGFINQIHTDSPTAKIIVAPNFPTNCGDGFGTVFQNRNISFNLALAGQCPGNSNCALDGSNPPNLTDPGGGSLAIVSDGVTPGFWTEMATGTGPTTYCWQSQYEHTDHEHSNDLARKTAATSSVMSFRKTATAAGLLN